MFRNVFVTALCGFLFSAYSLWGHDGHSATPKVVVPESAKTPSSQWTGKRVGFLGDSMSDVKSNASEAFYWQYLEELLSIDVHTYARSGYQWNGIMKKAEEMRVALGDSIDAIVIWAGTNDFRNSTPIGQFYTEQYDSVNLDGRMVLRLHRTFAMNEHTFCGRINKVMSYLKTHYPEAQIVLMTPPHRGYATFKATNVQPDENYANALGLYLDTYVETLKQAATLWAVPLIDLHSISGLHPMTPSHARYFHHAETDLLHPNAYGHYRIARTVQLQLLSLPVF